MQKLCPHGVETGLTNMSKQMGQRNCSSDNKLLLEAIFGGVAEDSEPGQLWGYTSTKAFGFCLLWASIVSRNPQHEEVVQAEAEKQHQNVEFW